MNGGSIVTLIFGALVIAGVFNMLLNHPNASTAVFGATATGVTNITHGLEGK
jgi:hypothetical protein